MFLYFSMVYISDRVLMSRHALYFLCMFNVVLMFLIGSGILIVIVSPFTGPGFKDLVCLRFYDLSVEV